MDLSKQPARPVPKPSFNIKNKAAGRRKKKQKKVETYKGVTIPEKRVRGQISKRDYEKAKEVFGEHCLVCGDPRIEMHHVRPKGMSNNGRGGWRNLAPLCAEHHRGRTGVHANYNGLSDRLKEERKAVYGEWFWADRFDLWKAGLIPNATYEAFESFMDREEVKAREALRERDCDRE